MQHPHGISARTVKWPFASRKATSSQLCNLNVLFVSVLSHGSRQTYHRGQTLQKNTRGELSSTIWKLLRGWTTSMGQTETKQQSEGCSITPCSCLNFSTRASFPIPASFNFVVFCHVHTLDWIYFFHVWQSRRGGKEHWASGDQPFQILKSTSFLDCRTSSNVLKSVRMALMIKSVVSTKWVPTFKLQVLGKVLSRRVLDWKCAPDKSILCSKGKSPLCEDNSMRSEKHSQNPPDHGRDECSTNWPVLQAFPSIPIKCHQN